MSEFKLSIDTSGVTPDAAPEALAHLLHRIADSMEEITMDAPGGQYRRQRVESGPLVGEWEWSV